MKLTHTILFITLFLFNCILPNDQQDVIIKINTTTKNKIIYFSIYEFIESQNLNYQYFESKEKLEIKYFNHNNRGFSYSRNLGIDKSSGEWIALLDHDDLCLDNRLQKQIIDINNNKNCKLFFGNVEIFNNKNTKINKFNNHQNKDKFHPKQLNLYRNNGYINLIKYGCFINSSSVIINKKIVKEIGGFDSKYLFIADYMLFLKVAKKYDIYCNNDILVRWRVHENQTTNLKQKILIRELNKFYSSIYFQKFSISIKYSIFKKHLKSIIRYCYLKILSLINK